ncbi:MAG: helix-turn-helix domain-containing protein [Micromonosporaceae bacterium]
MTTDQLPGLAGTVILVVGRAGVTIARERLRDARQQRGLSQRELAELVGVYGSDISAYETGRTRPDPATLRRLAAALDLDPLDLLDPDTPVSLPVLRSRAGLTQAAVAAAAGLSRSTYAAIERGDTRLDSDRAARIAGALSASVDQVTQAAGRPRPRTEYVVLPAHLVDQLERIQRPGEQLIDTLARLIGAADPGQQPTVD